MLLSDRSRSVLGVYASSLVHLRSYTPYGHEHGQHLASQRLGYNGEYRELGDIYLLGNGYRAYNATLVRFYSPDSLSPFGKGGRNTYAYCLGDPVNRIDPSGHFPHFLTSLWKGIRNKLGLRTQHFAAVTSPFERLPDEMLSKIFSYASDRSLLNLRATSKRFTGIATDQHLYNRFERSSGGGAGNLESLIRSAHKGEGIYKMENFERVALISRNLEAKLKQISPGQDSLILLKSRRGDSTSISTQRNALIKFRQENSELSRSLLQSVARHRT